MVDKQWLGEYCFIHTISKYFKFSSPIVFMYFSETPFLIMNFSSDFKNELYTKSVRLKDNKYKMSLDMRFPTMWHVQQATAHMRSLIRAYASCLNIQ